MLGMVVITVNLQKINKQSQRLWEKKSRIWNTYLEFYIIQENRKNDLK